MSHQWGIVACLLLALSACAPPGGLGPRASIGDLGASLKENYLQIVSFSRSLVEVEASGNLVRAPAPEGFCVSKNGVMTSRDAAFVLLEPCSPDPSKGVMSVSIGDGPMFDGESDLASLERAIASPEGAAQLGLDAGSGAVFLVDSAIRGETLYTVVRDASVDLGFAGDLRCKAFTELNGRMVVISLISGRGEERSSEAMLDEMERIVIGLKGANRRVGV